MSSEDEDVQLLAEVGFTKTQAKLYLTLLKLGKTDGKTLSKFASTPRPVVYRTLDELQKMGLVEREITLPYKFNATPLKQGLQILMNQRLEQYEKDRERMESFLREKSFFKVENLEEHKYRFKVVEGKERIIQLIRLQHDNAHRSIDILSTLQRWLQIIHYCLENYEKALERKVKYRIVLDKPESKIIFPKKVPSLLEKPNFELKLSRIPLKNNLAIFDGKEATFNFFPPKSLQESPIIWTNHPSFISMAQDHFEKIWKLARKYTPKVVNNL